MKGHRAPSQALTFRRLPKLFTASPPETKRAHCTQNIIQIERTIYRYDRWKGNPRADEAPGETAWSDLIKDVRPADGGDVPRHPLPADGRGDGRARHIRTRLCSSSAPTSAPITPSISACRRKTSAGCTAAASSVALDGHDVTFGCAKKVEAAFAEMMEEYHPQSGLHRHHLRGGGHRRRLRRRGRRAHSEQYGLPVMAVHTEHFKCENHLPGVERTMTACFDLMRARP